MKIARMGVVRLFMTMSIDGFVAGPDGKLALLYSDLPSLRDTDALAELIEATGAVVMGGRSYDLADTDEGYVDYEHQVPIFVVTHRPPERPARHDPSKGLSFTFVTEGVRSAVSQARAAAGEKDVQVIGGANLARQLLDEGLLDEIQISFVPVLLGGGLRLFDGVEPRTLERIKLIEGDGRTDIRYRVTDEA